MDIKATEELEDKVEMSHKRKQKANLMGNRRQHVSRESKQGMN